MTEFVWIENPPLDKALTKKQVSTAKIVILLIAIGIAGSAIGLF